MLTVQYLNKEGQKRAMTYHDEHSDLEELGFDLKKIIKQGATDIKIN